MEGAQGADSAGGAPDAFPPPGASAGLGGPGTREFNAIGGAAARQGAMVPTLGVEDRQGRTRLCPRDGDPTGSAAASAPRPERLPRGQLPQDRGRGPQAPVADGLRTSPVGRAGVVGASEMATVGRSRCLRRPVEGLEIAGRPRPRRASRPWTAARHPDRSWTCRGPTRQSARPG
jgi:hypothetical protein